MKKMGKMGKSLLLFRYLPYLYPLHHLPHPSATRYICGVTIGTYGKQPRFYEKSLVWQPESNEETAIMASSCVVPDDVASLYNSAIIVLINTFCLARLLNSQPIKLNFIIWRINVKSKAGKVRKYTHIKNAHI